MMGANGQYPIGGSGGRAAAIRAARDAAKSAREVEFPLPATGGSALVRRLDLLELIALDAIPASLQVAVDRLLETQLGDGGEPDLASIMRAAGGPLKALRQQQELADAACLAGFLDPRLVASPDDVTDPDRQLVLTEIERTDRLAYWEWCQGATEAAPLATVFREPAVAAAAGSASDPVRLDPLDVPLRGAIEVRR